MQNKEEKKNRRQKNLYKRKILKQAIVQKLNAKHQILNIVSQWQLS